MPTIQQLSQSMINKIAAGEVIERPASVVKELVENSIDAGATRIDVSVEKGGTDRLRIVDDGCGIAPEQLLLALTPHATSKITDADDLFRIRTFGFRGEALASIAEISRLTLKSRLAHSAEGFEIRSDGGALSQVVPCGMPAGTTIDVNNLFFNTPVRRKYMRSTATEFGHVLEAFLRLALPHPGVHFTLKHNDKIVHDLAAERSWLDRIENMFPNEIPGKLISVENRRGDVHVHGYVGHPSISRSNNRMQYFFLNGRHIRDRALQHALGEAFRGILTVGRFPVAFLQLEISPEQFDVNVHPTKMEVRFLDAHKIYGHFLGAIREKFLTVDLNASVRASDLSCTKKGSPARPGDASGLSAPHGEPPQSFRGVENDPRRALDEGTVAQNRRRIVDWAKNRLRETRHDSSDPVPRETFDPSDVNRAFEESFQKETLFDDTPHPPKRDSGHESPTGSNDVLRTGFPEHGPFRPFPTLPSSHDTPRPALHMHELSRSFAHENEKKDDADRRDAPEEVFGRAVLQVHHRYLVTETDAGLAIIDQHALHERILYERLKVRFESGKIDAQRLLVPVPLDLAPTEKACVDENRELLAQLGLTVEPFGGDTVLISGYPAILEKVDPRDILLGLLETLLESSKKPDRIAMLDEILHQMSCKAAMKAGDRLSPEAIGQLMRLAENEANAHHCPHGRPSTLLFTCEELDKMFRRT